MAFLSDKRPQIYILSKALNMVEPALVEMTTFTLELYETQLPYVLGSIYKGLEYALG